MVERVEKRTLGQTRQSGVRGILIYCRDHKCSHHVAILADHWADHIRLSDLEPQFVCTACGKRGAEVRPDFNWNSKPVGEIGYRPG